MSGRHLKKLRIANGFSQAQVARELHIDRTKVSRWENDIVLPNEEEIKALARLYSVETDNVKAAIKANDTDDTSYRSEMIIAEKLDELHLSVSNELNAAISNQEQSIRQQGEQIEIQKESLKRFSEQLQGEQRLKEEYRKELKENRDNYTHQIRNIMVFVIIAIIFLALMFFAIIVGLNYSANNHEYSVVVPAVEINEEEKQNE